MPLRHGPPTAPASARTIHLRGAPGALGGGTGACRSGLNSANLVSTPRAEAGSPSLPLNASRPHIPKHSPLPFSRRPPWRQPETGPRPAARERLPPRDAVPSPLQTVWPPHNTAARRTQSPPPRTGGAHGPGVGCARRPPTLRARHTSRAPRGPQSAAFTAHPPPSHSPTPRASPLRPGRSRFPAPPSSAPAQEAPPRSPLRNPPSPPPPLTAAQRPAAGAGGGGRRPGARKRPDRGDPGRTPYLGGRRGGDGGRAPRVSRAGGGDSPTAPAAAAAAAAAAARGEGLAPPRRVTARPGGGGGQGEGPGERRRQRRRRRGPEGGRGRGAPGTGRRGRGAGPGTGRGPGGGELREGARWGSRRSSRRRRWRGG